MWVSRAGGGKEVNEVWSKPLISFQRLPNIMGTWCKAFLPSLPRLYILKTMDPRQEPQPPRSYQRVWQGCEVLTSEDCSEVMCWRRFADSIRTLCSVYHKKGTFLGVTSTVQITPSPIHAGREHCSDLCWQHLTGSPWQSWGGAVGTIPREQMRVGEEPSASSRQESFRRNGDGRGVLCLPIPNAALRDI